MSSSEIIAQAVFEREISRINMEISKLNHSDTRSFLEQTMIQDKLQQLLQVREYMKSRMCVD